MTPAQVQDLVFYSGSAVAIVTPGVIVGVVKGRFVLGLMVILACFVGWGMGYAVAGAIFLAGFAGKLALPDRIELLYVVVLAPVFIGWLAGLFVSLTVMMMKSSDPCSTQKG